MYTAASEKQLFDLAKSLLNNPDLLQAEWLPDIKSVINYSDWKYYVQNNPVLADKEYDTLFSALKEIEAQNPELITPDSPTQRIAQGLSTRFPTVRHLVPMLSLENTYNAEDLKDWARKCYEALPDQSISFCVEPKYDGASISLLYENGSLYRGATRGDGIAGEDISINVKQIRSIPLSTALLNYGVQQMEIRGEVVIKKDDFALYNQQRAEAGLSLLANPRNAASGTLRMLDSSEVSKRRLSAVLYHVSDITFAGETAEAREALQTHYGTLQWLYHLGFPTPVQELKVYATIDEVIAYCRQFEEERDRLPYEIDGMVIKVNEIAQQEAMGMTAHHPRWAVAYKFKARQATSKLLQVEFQVGRTGAVTPVAKIEPVYIGGVMVGSISLFNEDVIREKDIRIGDTVLVERAGDVIPYIVKPLEELRDGSERHISFPATCPVCKYELIKVPGEAVWRCDNLTCPAQLVEHIIHFASKNAMDIRNLGEANVRKFYDLGLLKNIADIYSLDWTAIRALEGFKDKSVQNLQQAVEQSKSQTLNRVIFGLGIRHVGETTAKVLANAVSTIADFYSKTEEELMQLEDIGPKVAGSIVHFFRSEHNRSIIDALSNAGVNMSSEKNNKHSTGGQLSGKTFLFTGTLSRLKRSDAEALAESKGGKLLGSVSSKLDYLVVGENAGSKLEKAQKLHSVIILTEDEFLELVEKDNATAPGQESENPVPDGTTGLQGDLFG